jgi:hypothetical protein
VEIQSQSSFCQADGTVLAKYEEKLDVLILEASLPLETDITSIQRVDPVECGEFEEFESFVAIKSDGNPDLITDAEKSDLAEGFVIVYNNLAGQQCDPNFRSLDTAKIIYVDNDREPVRRSLLEESHPGDELTRELQFVFNPWAILLLQSSGSCSRCRSDPILFNQVSNRRRMLEEEWMIPASGQHARNLNYEGQCFCPQGAVQLGPSTDDVVAALNTYVQERKQLGYFQNIGVIGAVKNAAFLEVSFTEDVDESQSTLLETILLNDYNLAQPSCPIESATVLWDSILPGNGNSYVVEIQSQSSFCRADEETLGFLILDNSLSDVTDITSMQPVEPVECGDFEAFESFLAIEYDGDSDLITNVEKSALAEGFVIVYNNLAEQLCDPKFRSLDTTEIIYADGGQEVRRSLLEESLPGDELTRELAFIYNPWAILLLQSSGSCSRCRSDPILFNQVSNRRRMLEEEWMIPASNQHARNLNYEGQCFCRQNAEHRGPSTREFVIALDIYVRDNQQSFPHIGAIKGVKDITSPCESSVSGARDSYGEYFAEYEIL